MTGDVFPLVFQPIYRPKVWGGRNLERLFGKRLPAGAAIGESIECADLPGLQTVDQTGATLASRVAEWGADLLGRAALDEGRFPLLVKFLDAVEPLSVQVHPDRDAAARYPGARAKIEAWYVIEARPGAFVYLGLRPGLSCEALAAAVRTGCVEAVLMRVPVRAGQSYLVTPGMVHAIGAGVVVAEVETPSDTTYRLYDWGRQRPVEDGGLEIERGLACVRESAPTEAAGPRSHVAGLFTTVTRLAACGSFVVEKVRFVEGLELEIPYAELVVWVILEGRGAVSCSGGREQRFAAGDVIVLPAALKEGRVRTESDCVWLEVTIPIRSDLAAYPRPDAEALRGPGERAGGTIPLNVSHRGRGL